MVNPAYIMSSTVNKTVEKFPFPTIFPIVGELNYETIAKVHFKLNAISALVQYNLGYGQLGLLYLTVSQAVYKTLYATVFISQVNPGSTAIITSGATATIIANKQRSFANGTAIFK